jgi:hypothetical protein
LVEVHDVIVQDAFAAWSSQDGQMLAPIFSSVLLAAAELLSVDSSPIGKVYNPSTGSPEKTTIRETIKDSLMMQNSLQKMQATLVFRETANMLMLNENKRGTDYLIHKIESLGNNAEEKVIVLCKCEYVIGRTTLPI